MPEIPDYLSHLPSELVAEIQESAIYKEIPKGTEILRQGQYIKVIPLVIEGLIKVYTRYEDRELLLYYIQPSESCVMSFSAGMDNEASTVFAQTEEDTRALLLPTAKVSGWIEQYPKLNSLFFQQYRQRYFELLDSIHHVLFNKMDKRLYDHLLTKISIKNQNPIRISHQQLADELGTVREVISRVMRKLEADGLARQKGNTIEVLKM